MINETLESDLREWCVTLDNQLFEEKIYAPLTYLAKAICTRRKVSLTEYDDKVADLVSHVSITLPEHYDKTKGDAKYAAYILMDQHLQRHFKRSSALKRGANKIVYIQDSSKFEGILEIEVDKLEYFKATLKAKKSMFNNINKKLHCKIAGKIIEAVEYPEKYKEINGSYIKDIAKKSKCNINNVHYTIKLMREMVMGNNLF